MRTSRIVVAALALFFGCRSSSNNGPDGGGGAGGAGGTGGTGGDGGGGSGFYTIQQVQSDAVAAGTLVNLQGVVVTAVDLFGPSHEGDMWVEEPGGGPFSGIHVYNAAVSNATLEETLVPGDVVTITGAEKDSYAGDSTGRAENEIEPASGGTMVVTKTSHQDPLPGDSIDLAAIGALYNSSEGSSGGGSAYDNAWIQWDGVLVTASDVDVFSAPKVGSSGAADAYYMKIQGDSEIDSNMTAIAGSGTSYDFAVDSCLGTLTGVVEYYYGNVILPRSSTDLVVGGACVFENAANGSAYCTDDIDNDGNGFTDCADLGCEVGSAAYLGACDAGSGAGTCGCSTSYDAGSGAADINNSVTGSAAVYLHDVIVTGIDSGASRGYWFADSSIGGSGHGGFAYTDNDPITVSVGDSLASLQGIAFKYTGSGGGSLVEIEDPTAVVSGSGQNVNAPAVSPGVTSSNASYTSVLVTLRNVSAGALGAHNQITLTGSDATTIVMDDDAYYGYGLGSALGSATAPAGCYSYIIGVVEENTQDSIHTFNPRSGSDFGSAGSACN